MELCSRSCFDWKRQLRFVWAANCPLFLTPHVTAECCVTSAPVFCKPHTVFLATSFRKICWTPTPLALGSKTWLLLFRISLANEGNSYIQPINYSIATHSYRDKIALYLLMRARKLMLPWRTKKMLNMTSELDLRSVEICWEEKCARHRACMCKCLEFTKNMVFSRVQGWKKKAEKVDLSLTNSALSKFSLTNTSRLWEVEKGAEKLKLSETCWILC